MDKNVKLRYALESHLAERDEEGRFYCRALNTLSQEAYCYCKTCPLFGGFSRFGTEKEEPECWYYDLGSLEEEGRKPQQEWHRIQGLILAGVTKEFPDFLEREEETKAYHLIEEAIQFAAEAHKGDTRKGKNTPYIAHAMETMMLVAHMTGDNEVIAAAALHDVVEDTNYSIEDIRERFGDKIACLVEHETENKREELPRETTWKLRKQEQLDRVQGAPAEVKMIMLGDKLSNMRATLRDYEENPKGLWNKFNMKDEKEQEWYYRSVGKRLADLQKFPEYQEYMKILEKVFGNNQTEKK